MKKIFLIFVCASSFAVAHSQVSFGLKAGVNLANFSGDNEGSKSKIGFNAGGFAEIGLAESFSVKPELVYSSQGAKYTEDEQEGKLNLNYINIPILAKYTHTSGFFAETGPQIGFLASAKAKIGSVEVDAKDGMKKTDFAWALGIGYQLPQNIGFNARYNIGLANIADGEGNGTLKNSVFQFGLFYRFSSGK